MPALAATDVTVTVEQQRRTARQRNNRTKIVFGDGALTYPSGGVPMPGFGSFGLKKVLEYLILIDADDGSGIVWKYDAANNKLRGYIQGIIVSAAGGATVDDFALNTASEPMATAVSLSLTDNTGAGTKYFGKLIELTTSHAPASQTLYAEAVGQ